MEEQPQSTAGQGLGIAGFVLGLIALIISFIQCLGMFALLPGILAIVFSAIALTQANKANASKGLIIAALVISILGTSIAAWRFIEIRTKASKVENYDFKNAIEEEFGKDFEEAMKDASKELEKIATELEKEMEEVEEEKPDTIDGGE